MRYPLPEAPAKAEQPSLPKGLSDMTQTDMVVVHHDNMVCKLQYCHWLVSHKAQISCWFSSGYCCLPALLTVSWGWLIGMPNFLLWQHLRWPLGSDAISSIFHLASLNCKLGYMLRSEGLEVCRIPYGWRTERVELSLIHQHLQYHLVHMLLHCLY